MNPTLIFIVHCAATWFLTGLIWVIQIVHYPLFAAIPAQDFPAYEQRHQTLITWVVAPLMLVEVITLVMLIIHPAPHLPTASLWLGAALLAVIWLSTALWQMPLHERLSQAWNLEQINQLVIGNWLRTIAWTARGILCCWQLQQILVD